MSLFNKLFSKHSWRPNKNSWQSNRFFWEWASSSGQTATEISFGLRTCGSTAESSVVLPVLGVNLLNFGGLLNLPSSSWQPKCGVSKNEGHAAKPKEWIWKSEGVEWLDLSDLTDCSECQVCCCVSTCQRHATQVWVPTSLLHFCFGNLSKVRHLTEIIHVTGLKWFMTTHDLIQKELV